MEKNHTKKTPSVYLVGGAVRDQLLGCSYTERDWVVVGATPEYMLSNGYVQVGKDFPVFLHPRTKEEYALARIERKIGVGYTGFDCDTSSTVTLEEDLLRRDLTINAIAKDNHGNFIDPYNGIVDLKAKVLRHVSPAFSEDPLRILRVARFAARFAHLGFTIAPETIRLMQDMAAMGELNSLAAERVWRETEKALSEKRPDVYFSTLHTIGVTDKWFAPLYPTLSQNHILDVLQKGADNARGDAVEQQCALLAFQLKGNLTSTWLGEIKAPKRLIQLSQVAEKVQAFPWSSPQAAEGIHALFNDADVWRNSERFITLLGALNVLHQGPQWQQNYHNLQRALQVATQTSAKDLVGTGLSGLEIKAALANKRIAAIGEAINTC